MSILLSGKSRVLIQGLTGREGSFHTEAMKAYGTNIVGGVSPGKGGSTSLGVPVFDTVADARRATDADVSGIFVPAPFAADAIMEAAAAGLEQARRRSGSSRTTSTGKVRSGSCHAAGLSPTKSSRG